MADLISSPASMQNVPSPVLSLSPSIAPFDVTPSALSGLCQRCRSLLRKG